MYNQHFHYRCKQTPAGPKCYCPDGKKPEGPKCVDANECELDGSCAQKCINTEGSFVCDCVSGYIKNGTNCIAVNCKITPPCDDYPNLFTS